MLNDRRRASLEITPGLRSWRPVQATDDEGKNGRHGRRHTISLYGFSWYQSCRVLRDAEPNACCWTGFWILKEGVDKSGSPLINQRGSCTFRGSIVGCIAFQNTSSHHLPPEQAWGSFRQMDYTFFFVFGVMTVTLL